MSNENTHKEIELISSNREPLNKKSSDHHDIEDEKQILTYNIEDNNSRHSRNSNSNKSNSFSFSKSWNSQLSTIPWTKSNTRLNQPQQQQFVKDSIEAIFSQKKYQNCHLLYQNYQLLFIILVSSSLHYLFYFWISEKKERNYCFNPNTNQFNSCSKAQLCKNFSNKLNIFVYDSKVNFEDNFERELEYVNDKYTLFFIEQTYYVFNNTYYTKNEIDSEYQKINGGVLITNKEQWHFMLKYYSICESNNFRWMTVSWYIIGAVLGSATFGFISDIFGRRKIIVFLLIWIWTSLLGWTLFTCIWDYYYEQRYRKEFMVEQDKYNDSATASSAFNTKFIEIMELLFTQNKIMDKFRDVVIVLYLLFFLCSWATTPLLTISLALLWENSWNDSIVLKNARKFQTFRYALGPFFAYLVFPVVNNIKITFLIFFGLYLALIPVSWFTWRDSMRWYYEYCERKNMTDTVTVLIDLKPEDYDKNYYIDNTVNDASNKQNIIRQKTSRLEVTKTRVGELNKAIRRNSDFMWKRKEVIEFPYLLITCISSNRLIKTSKLWLIQITLLIGIIHNLTIKECFNFSFFSRRELFISFEYNYIVNSSFFLLLITIVISSFLFFAVHRISSFKSVVFVSLLLISVLNVLYHFGTAEIKNDSLNLNEYNIGMGEIFQEETIGRKINVYIYLMNFLINGVMFFLMLLFIKYSRTVYRCTLWGMFKTIEIIAVAVCEGLKEELKHTMLFAGVINFWGVLTVIFINEGEKEPYIINDVRKKGNNEREKEKDKENESEMGEEGER